MWLFVFLWVRRQKDFTPDFVSLPLCTGCNRVLSVTTNIIKASDLSGCSNAGNSNCGCGLAGLCCGFAIAAVTAAAAMLPARPTASANGRLSRLTVR